MVLVYTPLHLACRSENPHILLKATSEIIRELILNGAETQSRDREGRLPVELILDEECQSRAIYEEAVVEMDNRALKPVLK
jgi:ankyrin repeat protein